MTRPSVKLDLLWLTVGTRFTLDDVPGAEVYTVAEAGRKALDGSTLLPPLFRDGAGLIVKAAAVKSRNGGSYFAFGLEEEQVP